MLGRWNEVGIESQARPHPYHSEASRSMGSLCVYLGHMAGPRASTGPKLGLMVLFNFIFCVCLVSVCLSVCLVFVYCPLVLSGSLEESSTSPPFPKSFPLSPAIPLAQAEWVSGRKGPGVAWSPSDLLLRPPVLPSSRFKTEYPCL